MSTLDAKSKIYLLSPVELNTTLELSIVVRVVDPVAIPELLEDAVLLMDEVELVGHEKTVDNQID